MSKKDEVLEKCFSKARVIWLSKSTVAPFTGAWIETALRPGHGRGLSGRTLYGCVD